MAALPGENFLVFHHGKWMVSNARALDQKTQSLKLGLFHTVEMSYAEIKTIINIPTTKPLVFLTSIKEPVRYSYSYAINNSLIT